MQELQTRLAQTATSARPAAAEPPARMPFQEAVARVSSAIVASGSVDEMLAAVLDTTLDVFECDRAWLLFPCDPASPTWSIPMERTRPQWPGAGHTGVDIPMNQFARGLMARVLEADGTCFNDAEHDPYPPDDPMTAIFHIRSQMLLAIFPKRGKPWCLGLHHCGEGRIYSADDRELFAVLGSRIADGLTSFIAQQELRESQERLRTIIEHAPEAIAIIDVATGRIIESNQAATALYGADAAGLSLLTLAQLSPPLQPDGRDSSEALSALLAAAVAGGAPTSEWTHRNVAGVDTPCEIRMVRLPGGGEAQVRVSATDISARKRDEANRRELEDQLRHAQKLKSIGQLTGGIAHDFNNLLTAIVGNIEIAHDRAEDPERVRKHLGHATAAVGRAGDLTRRLLAFARKQALRPRPVDLNALVTDMDNLLRRTLGGGIAIETIHAGDLWTCEVDAGQLENAILNLAINARDATAGQGRLRIETANVCLDPRFAAQDGELEAGEYVMVAVSDDGHGMPLEVQRKAFEPFFSTKETGKGSGLGLSMVYGFVKQSGGDVRIDSQVGRGTSVQIYLPRAVDPRRSEALQPVRHDEPRGRGEHVLVVEDNPSVRQSTAALLNLLGYRCSLADDAEGALTMLLSDPSIELLFADVLLPGRLNGAALLVEARRSRPDLPALLTSGFAGSTALAAAGLDGAVDLIDKPFAKADLARRLHQVLASSRRREERHESPTQ
jgi:PAS domain S-box-containing protein